MSDPISLGFSPAKGTAAVEQCIRFKQAIFAEIGRPPEGANLFTVVKGRRRGLAIEAEVDTPRVARWIEAAQELAEELWERVAEPAKDLGNDSKVGVGSWVVRCKQRAEREVV